MSEGMKEMENNKLRIMQWKGCDSMLIIDTETTGLEGCPKDRVLRRKDALIARE